MSSSTSTSLPSTSVQASAAVSRTFARAAVIAAGAFVVILAVAGAIDDGYSQRSEAISALASQESDTAGLMVAGFVFLGLVAVGSGAALLRTLRSKAGKAAGVLTIVAGALTVACGFIRQDCSALQQVCLDREKADAVSGAHSLHNLLALPLFASLVIAGFLIASALRREPRRTPLARRVRLAAVLAVVSFVWFGSGAYGDNGGLVQRLMVLLTFGIPTVIALRLTSREA